MRTIARGLSAILDKPVGAASVTLDLFVGTLLGSPNDPTSTTHAVRARTAWVVGRPAPPGVRARPLPPSGFAGRRLQGSLRAAAGSRYGA